MANPWRHLGALAFLMFVACTVSGVYLYAVFDTSLAGAYESGRALDRDAFLVGRLVRGVHRYSADAFMLFTVLHLVREALRGHFRDYRAWSWISGVVLMPFIWIAGITGFWLAWDERAFLSAVATAEWLAAFPWQAALFARNFLTDASVNDRFFSLAVFLHLGVPLLALAATWVHVARLSHVRAWPPRAMTLGTLTTLAVLALAHPAQSLGRVEALAVPAAVAIDWFYFFPHVLAAAITPEGLWLACALAAIALVVLPWTGRAALGRAAAVDLAHCNGCARCAADCPFGAVVMVPRTDGRHHALEAQVTPALCAACGICVGACPSSNPLRRARPLASGIDLPDRPLEALRAALDSGLDGTPLVVFACAPGRLEPPDGRQDLAWLRVECAAMVPPSFIDYALRRGARGVLLAGCRECDCEYRLGDRWSVARMLGTRAPVLRERVPRGRVRLAWCGPDAAALERELDALLVHPRPEVRHA